MKNWSLAHARQQRATDRARAAAGREARGEHLALDLGGPEPVVLDAEFPITALAPLRAIDDEMGFLIKKALDVAQARGADDEQRASTQLVVELLILSPNLPTTMIDIAVKIGTNLLGEQGIQDLQAARPSGQDIAALVTELFDWWGLSLGESLGSSESSTSDGGTLSPTSPGSTTDSTPVVSFSQPDTAT